MGAFTGLVVVMLAIISTTLGVVSAGLAHLSIFPVISGLAGAFLLPVLYGISGGLSGIIFAFLFSLASRWLGGLEVEFH